MDSGIMTSFTLEVEYAESVSRHESVSGKARALAEPAPPVYHLSGGHYRSAAARRLPRRHGRAHLRGESAQRYVSRCVRREADSKKEKTKGQDAARDLGSRPAGGSRVPVTGD